MWRVDEDGNDGESNGGGDAVRLNDGIVGDDMPDESGESSSSVQRPGAPECRESMLIRSFGGRVNVRLR